MLCCKLQLGGRLLGLLIETDRALIPQCKFGLKIMETKQHTTMFSTTAVASSSKTNEKATCLIVGLGNLDVPKTRHSVGMLFVDYLATQLGAVWSKDRASRSLMARSSLADTLELVMMKSKLPMNLNGKSIAKAASELDIPINHIYLVHDELDKAVGKFSMKEGGSARGHRGVKSAIQCLKTEDIPRLRLGIDRPSSQNDVVNYVMERFSPEELDIVRSKFPSALQLLMKHIQRTLEIEQNLYKLAEEKGRG